MKVDREKLLKVLTIASVGLTNREILEQSNAFIFTNDEVVTFNGEILTRCPSPLPEVEGAVVAEDFHKLLHKFPDDEVSIVRKGNEIILRGGRRSAGLTLQAEVTLPYGDVPKPKKWKKVPEILVGVLLQAARVCGRDETQPRTTEVHITPNWIESSDNFRLFRYTMKTGFSKDCLIPAASLEAIGSLVFTHVCEGTGWIHFKTIGGHRITLRCSQGEYPNLTPLLKLTKPKKVVLPSNLADILSRAEVMQESTLDAEVDVLIEKGKLTLKSRKDTGWFKETKKINYTGTALEFKIHPKFLEDVLAKTRVVKIGGNRMKLTAPNVVFIVCLKKAPDDD